MILSRFRSYFSLKLFLQIFGAVAILLTIFPFVPVDHWSVRIFDFPHLQLTLLTMLALLTYFYRFDVRKFQDYLFVIALSACFLFQGLKIFPYTAFAKYEVNDASSGEVDYISIYTANVLQDNENVDLVVKDTERFDADIVLFTETNSKWIRSLNKELGQKYPHKIEAPMENTYGMLLYSKYRLEEASIKFLIEDTIPSIHTKIVLPAGKKIQLFAIHPAPPTPQHNPSSVDRDAELMKIAKLSLSAKVPVIVLGDFNDVAWSESTSLFSRFSGLLDLRKGRGFFSTYNAKSWIMRWPLDHIFSSPDFRVLDVQLGNKTGSDHFPFYTRLSLEPELASKQRLPKPSKKEIEEAFEQIDNEKEEDKSDGN
ncbi:endonuclease/exonuclease/phosphatase family protein [Flavobacteriaceae bacterium KMM 6897]|nr:endonuclease/exonuclease/phosphatase family protein [Flavobacteriaceae bacterium KMM 6897]